MAKERNLTVACECPLCHSINFVDVNVTDYDDYVSGELAHKALWYMAAEEREMLISGLCLNCQDEFFDD